MSMAGKRYYGADVPRSTGPHPDPMENLCPRCRQRDADPVLLGTESEGHICGSCWVEDRQKDGPEFSYSSQV